jgi:hypothetical protein
MNEKCHDAEISDYIVYFIADVSETRLRNWLKVEENKPAEQINWAAIIAGEVLKLSCHITKNEVNSHLCKPIGN